MARRTVILPYDVLCVVASFIQSRDDLLSFLLAAKLTRDAGLPYLYRDIHFSSHPDIRPAGAIPISGDWYRVTGATERLFSKLYSDVARLGGNAARGYHQGRIGSARPTEGASVAGFVRSLRHEVVPEEVEIVGRDGMVIPGGLTGGDTAATNGRRRVPQDNLRGMSKERLVYLVETLPMLESLYLTTEDLTYTPLSPAMSTAGHLKTLNITSHRSLHHSCTSLRLATSTPSFLPLWGNISSPTLKSLTLTSLPPSCRLYLDRISIPGSVEIWQILSHCPNIKHLDIRVVLTSRDNRNNYITDFAGRAKYASSLATSTPVPIVHLESLRLQNCTLAAWEFNRLGPDTMKSLHIPYNLRKRLFRDLTSASSPPPPPPAAAAQIISLLNLPPFPGQTGQFANPPAPPPTQNLPALPQPSSHPATGGMIFPRNLKSLVVDSLPLTPERKEPWQEVFDAHFAALELDELIVLTKKGDFILQGSGNASFQPTTTFTGHGVVQPQPGAPIVVGAGVGGGMPAGGGGGVALAPAGTFSRRLEDLSINTRNVAVGMIIGAPPAMGMGSHLSRLLLKGSWQLKRSHLDSLLRMCWGLEELGVALLWRDWGHDLNLFTPSIKRLRRLRALLILNEPQSANMNAEWGAPLATKNKVWGKEMDVDMAFLQAGAPQEALRWWGVGKKMWAVKLEEMAIGGGGGMRGRGGGGGWRYNSGGASSSASSTTGMGKMRRVLREVDREGVQGIGILEWVRFCDECWVADEVGV